MNNLSYLGERFEIKFLNQIIGSRFMKGKEIFRDAQYGMSVLGILTPEIFNLSYSKTVLNIIKNYYEKYHTIPFYDTLNELICTTIKDADEKETLNQFLKDINTVIVENKEHIKNSAKTFIQQQNFALALENAQKELRNGKMDSFVAAADLIRKSIQVNDITQKPTQILSDEFEVVNDESRNPISSGMGDPMDKAMNGGLSRGEMGIFGAGYKVGKTTYGMVQATKAFSLGKTVLYIGFEDTEQQLRSKLQACWTGLEINEARKIKNKEFVEKTCKKFIKKCEDNGGKLFLKKFDPINTKWGDIESYLYYMENIMEVKIDMLIFDYLECINSNKQYAAEQWYLVGPEILREIENAIQPSRFNCAAWVFLQGKKDTYGVSDVEPTELGGSVKILQIGHILITVGKSQEQVTNGRANINIWGSRLGVGRMQFKDCIFDNARVNIKIEDENMVGDFQKNKK